MAEFVVNDKKLLFKLKQQTINLQDYGYNIEEAWIPEMLLVSDEHGFNKYYSEVEESQDNKYHTFSTIIEILKEFLTVYRPKLLIFEDFKELIGENDRVYKKISQKCQLDGTVVNYKSIVVESMLGSKLYRWEKIGTY
jgi:hypothetical protein